MGIVDNLRKPFEVGKEKMGALVGGKTTGKADEKGIGIDAFENRNDTRGIALVLNPVIAELVAHEADEFVFHHLTHIPNLFIGHIIDFLPQRTVILTGKEVGSEVFYIELFPFRSGPCGHVHTIGNVTYMQLVGRIAFPDGLEHALRHLAVEPAHTVDFLTGIASKDTHAEFFARAGVLTSQIHQFSETNSQFCREFAHIFAKERLIEIVVAGGHRGVHGIKRRSAYHFQGLCKGEFLILNIVDETLYVDESSVAFVAVINIFLDTQAFEHENTAYAEQILLFHAVFPVATVKLIGDGTVILAVEFQIGIHEVERHSTHIYTPNVGIDNTAGIGYFENNGVTVFIDNLFDGELVEVLGFVVGQLLAVHGEGLGEISIPIEETDGNHVDIAVTGLFEVVSGQYTQTA